MSELTLIFKTGGSYEGFSISSLKVKAKHSYKVGETCDCSEHRVTGDCVVSEFVNKSIRHVYLGYTTAEPHNFATTTTSSFPNPVGPTVA